ncbi:hypothetical protein S58_17510 [Bradyrhizobium oligotrophicum S58]|uniref:Uncharacterized protein n=1 Tax=Bradyrhizobium oligotrophicum S58 TaxID=1245469 RepID=M4Z354_9BRAD|nr:hypothetical protein [Bradyrhizobium oligotrophicum]BAM87758.1 hypothetical protein S58_17510 [Bradyrhizobium oligotrophicum S58]
MALGLTRKMLMVAGRLVVLAYLICVLSPGLAMAFGCGPAPCLDGAAVAVSHHEMAADAQMHAAHAHHHDHRTADAGMQAQHAPAPAPSHHDHSRMPGACCAMMCAVGLAATLPAVTLPSPLATASEAVRETTLPGRTPPRLDRPPIVLV